MLFFYRLANVPDGSRVAVTLTGQTNPIGVTGTFSADGGPTGSWDPSSGLQLRAPHDYDAEIDLVTVQNASFTINVNVTTLAGAPYGSPFTQAITASPGDLNTVHCDFTMEP